MVNRQSVETDRAPQAIGTYSQAIRIDNTVYCSGQIPLDPATGQLVKGDFRCQTRQVFDNLLAVCQAAGGTLDDAAKINISLTDLNYFAVVNEVMAEYFAKPYPARACVGVASLPLGAMIEVEAVIELKSQE